MAQAADRLQGLADDYLVKPADKLAGRESGRPTLVWHYGRDSPGWSQNDGFTPSAQLWVSSIDFVLSEEWLRRLQVAVSRELTFVFPSDRDVLLLILGREWVCRRLEISKCCSCGPYG